MKFLNFVFFIVLCLTVNSCSGRRTDTNITLKINEIVASISKDLPRAMGKDIIFEKLEYDQNKKALVAYFKFPYYSQPNAQTIASMKHNLLRSFSVTELKPLAELVRDNGDDIIWKVRGNDETYYYELICSNNELVNELSNSNQSREEILRETVNYMIVTTNANLPFQADDYCVCQSLSEENRNLVYLYVVDETKIDFDIYKSHLLNASEFKQYLSESANQDHIEKKQYAILAEIGYGMINRYKGSLSGKILNVTLTTQDIMDISK